MKSYFRIPAITWVLFLTGYGLAFGGRSTQNCTIPLISNDSAWLKLQNEVLGRVLDVKSRSRELFLPAHTISRIHKKLGSGNRADVYLVSLASGKLAALKVFRALDRAYLARGLVVQQFLGELGLAPKLYGTLSSNAFRNPAVKWNVKFRGERLRSRPGSPSFGVLMEYLGPVVNLKRASQPDALGGPTFNWVKVCTEIRKLQTILGRLRVLPFDAQIFLLADGRVLLGDLDDYTVASPSANPSTDWRFRGVPGREHLGFINVSPIMRDAISACKERGL